MRQVIEVPLGAQVIANSDKTGVEMFQLGDNIMGIQGHPEYTKDIVCNIIDRLLESSFIKVRFQNLGMNNIWANLTQQILKKNSSLSFFPCFPGPIIINILKYLKQSQLAEEAKASMEEAEADREIWEKLCKKFLKANQF